jgi:hypothetical protein
MDNPIRQPFVSLDLASYLAWEGRKLDDKLFPGLNDVSHDCCPLSFDSTNEQVHCQI